MHSLVHYTHICQVSATGLEILIDRMHDIKTTTLVQEHILSITYQKLEKCSVLLEGDMFKPP